MVSFPRPASAKKCKEKKHYETNTETTAVFAFDHDNVRHHAPMNAFAWSYMPHANSANIIYLKTLSNYVKNGKVFTDVFTLLNNEIDKTLQYSIPKEFYDAITKYPEAFRAGSLGPDFYPDMPISGRRISTGHSTV